MNQHVDQAPLVVGLTGGIASGKSTVANLFAKLGVPVIDTDVIAREVVEPGQPALQKIIAFFGETILAADGTLDRAKLRSLVFSDEPRRRELEAILHPVIRRTTLQRVAETRYPYCIVAVPLMFETGFDALTDHVLTVSVNSETQLQRLLARDASSEAEARSIIDSQMSASERNSRADSVISNDGEAGHLEAQVDELHQQFLSIAAAR